MLDLEEIRREHWRGMKGADKTLMKCGGTKWIKKLQSNSTLFVIFDSHQFNSSSLPAVSSTEVARAEGRGGTNTQKQTYVGPKEGAGVIRLFWQIRWLFMMVERPAGRKRRGSFVCDCCYHRRTDSTPSGCCQLLDLCVQSSDDPFHCLPTLRQTEGECYRTQCVMTCSLLQPEIPSGVIRRI